MPHRIFIVGAEGQMAHALSRAYAVRGSMFVTAGRAIIDVTDRRAVREKVSEFGPDLVINTAAYTAVDGAEDDVELAYKVNCDGAGNVAEAADMVGAPLIHLSTDYVFDGLKPTPYLESDSTNPINVYGRSKRAGELALAAASPRHIILRTSWLYSANGGNFVRTILRLAKERDEVIVVDDQTGMPTFADDLASAIVKIGDRLLSSADAEVPFGIYHAAGPGAVTWFRFACAIIASSMARGGASCFVRAIASNQYPARARRPSNSCLDSEKLAAVFGIRLPAWPMSLERCLDQLTELGGAST
jgi:dTDP-4-dehydrorhamnose reductase